MAMKDNNNLIGRTIHGVTIRNYSCFIIVTDHIFLQRPEAITASVWQQYGNNKRNKNGKWQTTIPLNQVLVTKIC